MSIDADLLDRLTGEPSARTNAPGSHACSDVSCDGRFALLSRLMQRGDDDFLLVDLQSGAELLLFGANDTSCPVIEAEQVVEHLRTRGVLVEYVLFPDEGHGGRRVPNRVLSTVEGTRRCVRYLTERA